MGVWFWLEREREVELVEAAAVGMRLESQPPRRVGRAEAMSPKREVDPLPFGWE